MSDALYMNMFAKVQSSSFDRKRRLKAKIMERFGRFAIYGTMISLFASQAAEPTFYASVAAACCLALECFR